MSLTKIFGLDYKAFNASLALIALDILLVEYIIFVTNHQAQYLLSAVFGTLFVGLSDPGGHFHSRIGQMGITCIAGALLTVLGFSLGMGSWVGITAAAFVVTLLGGLSIKFGVHHFVTGLVLNIWFLVAIGLGGAYNAASHIHSNSWYQALAWILGAAFWMAIACAMWLIRGRQDRPRPVSEMPDGISRPLTRPIVLFMIIRALTLAVAVAIPFGLGWQHAYWIPITTLIAMKADLSQSALASVQRLAGALLGALLAALLLAIISNKLMLPIISIALLANAIAIRFANYAYYSGAIAAGVLVALDITHPTNLSTEEQRVLYTLAGVGIGLTVMLMTNQLQKRTKKKPQTV